MVISETTDYEQLVDLFIRNELEFSRDKPIVKTDIAKCWKSEKDNNLIGGCMLAKREGNYKLDGLAIDPLYRNEKIGSKLLQNALNYIKEQDGHSMYLVAKIPEFYLKHGFRFINREEAPISVKCFTCSQYNVSCFPQVMKIDF